MAEKAKIFVEGENGGKEGEIVVQFNPESYQLSYGVSYSEKKRSGQDGPISQFVSEEAMTLAMTLYFDTYTPPAAGQPEGGTSVAEQTKKLSRLMEVREDLLRPPTVRFCWNKLIFSGYVESVKESYTMFLSDGTPVRAKVDVTFHSLFEPEKGRRAKPVESPDRSKLKVLKEGEMLWNYAWQEYRDVECWREIAAANGIKNPLEAAAGTLLKLPPR